MLQKSKFVVPLASIAAFIVIVLAAGVTETKADRTNMDQLKRGEYLVTLGGCGDCHSPKKMTEYGIMEDSTQLLSGQPASEVVTKPSADMLKNGWIAACNANQSAWLGPWGVSFAANITSDKKTGIGSWTEEQFIKAMRSGKHRGVGRQILPPMPWYNIAKASDDDLKSIFEFLMSTKPIENEVPEPIAPGQ